jgi:aryl sulfotransferase
VLSWVDQPWLPVHVLRYEDAVADPVRAFGAAFTAAGVPAGAAELAAAVERCAFDRLAAAEAAGGFRERPRLDTPFLRRGQAGGWRDELPGALADSLVAAHRDVLERFGYLD